MKINLLLMWLLLRLPMLLAGLYLFRESFLVLLEKYFNLALIYESVVYIVSTAWLRGLLFIPTAIALVGIFFVIEKRFSKFYWVLFLSSAFVFFIIIFDYLLKVETSVLNATLAITILTINTIPENWLAKFLSKNRFLDLFFIITVGIPEALVIQPYFYWLTKITISKDNIKKQSWIFGILLACFYVFFLFTPYNNQRLLTLGEKLHPNPAVEKFAEGSYNWIELNLESNLLYASGHEINYIVAYDMQNPNLPPLKSNTKVSYPQSFAYNSDLQEIYVFKRETNELLYLNATSLEVKRAVPVHNLSPGDIWINWHPEIDAITIASEADFEVGTPFLMLSRETGEILASISLPLIPTNVAFDTENNIFFFNSFRDTYLVAWDMQSYQVIQQAEISPRTDRLIYNSSASEILIASPQEGAILRYDATTLEFKGKIETNIGDRTLALDQTRNLLLVGNFINNHVQIIDLTTYQRISRFYIGPWIRTITLDTKNGIAYISTIKNIFKLTYIN